MCRVTLTGHARVTPCERWISPFAQQNHMVKCWHVIMKPFPLTCLHGFSSPAYVICYISSLLQREVRKNYQFTTTWYKLWCKQGFPAHWTFSSQRQLRIKGHMFNVLLTEFPLFNASTQADGNQAIIKKLIAKVFHQHGVKRNVPGLGLPLKVNE